jgi:hypothetical protein
MAKQKKQGKNGYLNDFHQAPNGDYIYTGPQWQAEPQARKALLTRLWLLQIGILAAVLVPGVLDTPGLDNCAYVILPYLFSVAAICLLTYTLGRLTAAGNPIRGYVYERTVLPFQGRAVLPMVGAALTALGLAIDLFRNGAGEKGAAAVLCFGCCALQFLLSFYAKKTFRGSIWAKIP